MKKGSQIERGWSRSIGQGCKKVVKRLHVKFLRRQGKDINNPNPKSNRYDGWIM